MQPGPQPAWQPPSNGRTTRLLMAEGDPIDGRFVVRLLEASPDLASTVAAAKQLATLLRRKGDEALADALAAADATMIRSFVVGLRKDIDAVQASLKRPWTTGPVEGQV